MTVLLCDDERSFVTRGPNDLEAKATSLRKSDTEILPHLYEERGDALVDHINECMRSRTLKKS